MANSGLDVRELEKLRDELKSLADSHSSKWDEFMKACVKELTARLLAKVIKRTPVGQYPAGSGKMGGTLRRGWTAGQGAAAYAQSLPITKEGANYIVVITNPVEYALT